MLLQEFHPDNMPSIEAMLGLQCDDNADVDPMLTSDSNSPHTNGSTSAHMSGSPTAHTSDSPAVHSSDSPTVHASGSFPCSHKQLSPCSHKRLSLCLHKWLFHCSIKWLSLDLLIQAALPTTHTSGSPSALHTARFIELLHVDSPF